MEDSRGQGLGCHNLRPAVSDFVAFQAQHPGRQLGSALYSKRLNDIHPRGTVYWDACEIILFGPTSVWGGQFIGARECDFPHQ